MSRFDLGNAGDFSRVTQQSLGDIAALIDGKDPQEWDILEGSYNGVLFHVFKSKVNWQAGLERVQDVAGRRKVKYKYPYRDGQTTDDLGRLPGSFTITCLIHGIRYMQGFNALMNEFNKPTPGTLIHPVRGQITVAVEDIQIAHQNDQRKAVALVVTFIEHNFTIGDLRAEKDDTVKGWLAAAMDIFKSFDAANVKVENTELFVRAVKNRIKSLISSFAVDSGLLLTTMNVTFNGGNPSDIPALLPVNLGGTRQANGVVTDTNFVVVRSVSDPFNNVPVEVLSDSTTQAVAVIQLQKQMISLRTSAANIITQLEDEGGSFEFFDDILNIRSALVLIQKVFETGVATSNTQIIDYKVPRLMTIREVAFANGLPVDRVGEIDVLNPFLLSVNFIDKDTILKVPVT